MAGSCSTNLNWQTNDMDENLMFKMETGSQLLGRLEQRKSLHLLEPDIFGSGLEEKSVIEVYGEAGIGKTELLLHFVVKCIMPTHWLNHNIGGLQVGVIFVDTDYHFTLLRLICLLENRLKSMLSEENSVPTEEELQQFLTLCLENMYVVHCQNSLQLIIALNGVEQFIANKSKYSLLIIDSISAFYWEDRMINMDNFAQLDTHYKQIAVILKKLTTEFNLTVVFSKQHLMNYKQGHRQSETSNHCPLHEENNYLGRNMQKLLTWKLELQNCKEHKFIKLFVKNKLGYSSEHTSLTISECGIKIRVMK